MGNLDVQNAARQLFARINTTKAENGQAEKLDEAEVRQARSFGFNNLFNITNNMTEQEFVTQYCNVEFSDAHEEDAFNQQERNIHVKYIQLKYGVKTEIQEGESIEQFEARAKDEGLNNAIDAEVAKMPEFGLNEKDASQGEYVVPDPTMSRDSKTHDW